MRRFLRFTIRDLLWLTLVVAVSVAWFVHQRRADEANEKTKQLFEKRVAVRSQLLKLVTDRYQQGTGAFSQVLEAQGSLLRARLDLCKTKEERIEIHEEMVRVAERALALATRHFQAGEAAQTEVLKGEAQLLEVQIELEHAKAAK